MVDLKMELTESGADLVLEAGDLARDDSLTAAVLISLYSDRRARDDDRAFVENGDRRGWWGDSSEERLGSHLWLLERAKVIPQTFNEAREHVSAALQWLIDERIAERVDVEVGADDRSPEGMRIGITVARGTATLWPALWEAQAQADYEAPGITLKLLK